MFIFFVLQPLQLSLGAVQGHGLQKPILSNRNFHGCLENLLFNGVNVIDLAKQNNPQVSVMVSCCVRASPAAHSFVLYICRCL